MRPTLLRLLATAAGCKKPPTENVAVPVNVKVLAPEVIVVSTIWYWLVFLVTAPLILVVGTLVFLVTAPFDPQRRAIHAFICAPVLYSLLDLFVELTVSHTTSFEPASFCKACMRAMPSIFGIM